MLFNERNFDVVDGLRGVAQEQGRSIAEIALAWVEGRPGVSSVLIGASRVEQLRRNLASLSVELSGDQLRRLDEATALPPLNPYLIFGLPPHMVFGAGSVRGWPGG